MGEPTTGVSSRRRSGRLMAPGDLEAVVTSLGLRITTRDLSEGGFAALTPRPFELESLHIVQLRLGQTTVTVKARVAHCRRLVTLAGGAKYLAGFAIVGRPRPGEATMEDLIDCITSTLLSVDPR